MALVYGVELDAKHVTARLARIDPVARGEASCVSFPPSGAREPSAHRCLTAKPNSRRSSGARRWSPSRWWRCSIISVVAVLYVAKAFFLPVVTAFVVGTMLSPAAGFLERHRIPRAVRRS